MLVSQGIKKLLFVVGLLYLLFYSSVGRIVGVSELCSYVRENKTLSAAPVSSIMVANHRDRSHRREWSAIEKHKLCAEFIVAEMRSER